MPQPGSSLLRPGVTVLFDHHPCILQAIPRIQVWLNTPWRSSQTAQMHNSDSSDPGKVKKFFFTNLKLRRDPSLRFTSASTNGAKHSANIPSFPSLKQRRDSNWPNSFQPSANAIPSPLSTSSLKLRRGGSASGNHGATGAAAQGRSSSSSKLTPRRK